MTAAEMEKKKESRNIVEIQSRGHAGVSQGVFVFGVKGPGKYHYP